MGYVIDTKSSHFLGWHVMMLGEIVPDEVEMIEMRLDFVEMVNSVGQQAEIPKSEAAHMIQVTIKTLGERLTIEDRRWLATRLPAEANQYLDPEAPVESFSLNHFYERVAVRTGKDLPTAVAQVTAVMESMKTAMATGDFARLKETVPVQFYPLFDPEPAQENRN